MLWLVRHGKSSAGFSEALDPDLSELGHSQAEEFARSFSMGPAAIVTSPLWRARSTAAPLARSWCIEPRVVPVLSEIPTPDFANIAARRPWLDAIMKSRYSEQPETVRAWREDLAAFALSLVEDTVGFTHFLTINALISVSAGADEIVELDDIPYCAAFAFEIVNGAIRPPNRVA